MKLNYNMNENYITYLSEAMSNMIFKNKIKKNPKKKIPNIHQSFFKVYFSLMFIWAISFIILKLIIDINYFIMVLIFLFISTICFLLFALLCSSVFLKTSKEGILEINKTGITDTMQDYTIFVPWKNIEMIVIGKMTVTFITNSKMFLFINVELKEEVLKEINKYQFDVSILDQSL